MSTDYALIEQLRHACSVALGDLLAHGMSLETSTGKLLLAAIGAAEKGISDMYTLVHTDGGPCHGTALVDGRCPGCGIAPDMQSTELWPMGEVKQRQVEEVKRT
jgi:hypothetical protein